MAINAALENVLTLISLIHWTIPNTLGNGLEYILPSPIFGLLFGTLVALDSWGRMILKITVPNPKRLHEHILYLPTPSLYKCDFLVLNP